jgi:hypothetical protein
MKYPQFFLTGAFLAFALITACAEQPSDLQPDAPGDSELLAHTPHAAPTATAALLAAAPDYSQLDGASVQGSGGSIQLGVDAGGEIPRQADSFIESVAVFGYAWADLDTGQGIVAVIHPAIGRDSNQNPDGWHTHPVQLTGGTVGNGGTSDFCIVSIGRSQAGIAIQTDRMQTNISVHWAGLDADALDVAASFIVQIDAGCSGTGLGVDVLDTESL